MKACICKYQAHVKFIYSCIPGSTTVPDYAQTYCKSLLKGPGALPPVRASRGNQAVIHPWSLTGVHLDFITLPGPYNTCNYYT